MAPVEDEKPPTLGPSKKDSIGKTDFEQALAAATPGDSRFQGQNVQVLGLDGAKRGTASTIGSSFRSQPFAAFPILRQDWRGLGSPSLPGPATGDGLTGRQALEGGRTEQANRCSGKRWARFFVAPGSGFGRISLSRYLHPNVDLPHTIWPWRSGTGDGAVHISDVEL